MSYDEETARLRLESAHSQSRGLPMFAEVRPLARRQDPETSKRAAISIADHLHQLHRSVLDAFHEHGPMGARTAERLSRFSGYGPSTIRKRISELAQRGFLFNTGLVDLNCVVYSAMSSAGTSPRAA